MEGRIDEVRTHFEGLNNYTAVPERPDQAKGHRRFPNTAVGTGNN